VGEDALMYEEYQGLSLALRARLASVARKGDRIISGDKAWDRQWTVGGIRGDEPRRIVTEAALFGTRMHHELYLGQPLRSDDAGQFKIPGLLHALCWLHAERSIRELVPLSPREQEAIDGVRDAVWKYYQRRTARHPSFAHVDAASGPGDATYRDGIPLISPIPRHQPTCSQPSLLPARQTRILEITGFLRTYQGLALW